MGGVGDCVCAEVSLTAAASCQKEKINSIKYRTRKSYNWEVVGLNPIDTMSDSKGVKVLPEFIHTPKSSSIIKG